MKKTNKQIEQERLEKQAAEAVRLIKIQEQAEQCADRLKTFLRVGWHVIEPGVPFQDNWHLDVICDHLEALARREIRKLIINISPRSLKSKITSVVFPAWIWIKHPEEKFLAASFGRQIALRDSRYCRNLIASSWYQARWGNNFSLAIDQNEKGRFENNKGGFRIVASVEGGILGEGGSCRLYDDPNDLDRMIKEPDSYPQSVRDWYSGTASSRSIDPRTDIQLCVQQRSSFGADLTEYLMELGGWEQLVIPNEYDGRRTLGPLALPDPRTHMGELMFPARLGPEETATLKREKKVHYPGQYNQTPSVAGKTGLRREWFQFWVPKGALVVGPDGQAKPVRISLNDGSYVERIPVELPMAFEQTVQSWDMAFKDAAANDLVAGHVWGRIGANTFLIARDSGHKDFPATLASVREMSKHWPCPEKLVEEKANGAAVIQTLRNEIPGLIPINPEGGKWSRVAAISGYVEAGNVYLPSPDMFTWVWDLLAEFAAGQAAKHDDDTDAMSQALRRLYDAQAQAGVPEFRVSPRIGEPNNATHIGEDAMRPGWRRFLVIVPSRAALWMAETQTGSLRIYRELDLIGMDAGAVGRAVAQLALSEIRNVQNREAFEIYLPKTAFVAVEPIGCWAELMEQALTTWNPVDGTWDERQEAIAVIRKARFRCDLIEEDAETALDRLRGLLAWAPPAWTPLEYDREKAFNIAEADLGEYHRYMAAVNGKVFGEWPKLKIFPCCVKLIAEMGTLRRDKLDDCPAFMEALLLGVSAPRHMEKREVVAKPYVIGGRGNMRNQRLLGKKFAMR